MVHMVPTFINIYHRELVPGSRDPGSSNTTTIIIAASASVGGVILALILLRIFWRCCRRQGSTAVPLPPVQPLAHVREQRLAQFVEQNYNDSALLSTPRTFLSNSRNGSKVSLLQKEPSSSSIPSSHTSLGLADTGEVFSAPPTQAKVPPLPLLSPSFQDASPSPSSLGSEMGTTILPETPLSFNSSVSRNRSTSSTHPDLSRSISRPRLRPRPVSMTSISSTTTSRSSRTIRGVPHGPHSNVKIVLPAPLASVLHPYMDGRRHTFIEGQGYDHLSRLSVVDKWAPRAIKSTGALTRESRSLSLERASSSSQSSISRSRTSPHRAQLRNVTGSPSLSTGPSPFSRSQPERAPPVPRIPSIYDIHTTPELDRAQLQEEEADIRGRPRGVSVLAASRPPSRSRPQQQTNKLQKPSRP